MDSFLTKGVIPAGRKRMKTSLRSKWTEKEDKTLMNAVKMYQKKKVIVNFRLIASTIPGRTTKQCRERYENSLAPLKRGDWTIDEIIKLSELMIDHGQNWAKLRDSLKDRSYNGIKKKGRKLLGEATLSSLKKKNGPNKTKLNHCMSTRTSNSQKKLDPVMVDVEDSFNLLDLHKTYRYNFKMISRLLPRNIKSEAELERTLYKICKCHSCSKKLSEISVAMDTYNENYKKAWTRIKASEKKREYTKLKLSPMTERKSKTQCSSNEVQPNLKIKTAVKTEAVSYILPDAYIPYSSVFHSTYPSEYPGTYPDMQNIILRHEGLTRERKHEISDDDINLILNIFDFE